MLFYRIKIVKLIINIFAIEIVFNEKGPLLVGFSVVF